MKKLLSLGLLGLGLGLLILICSYDGMGLVTEKILKKNMVLLNQKQGFSVVLQDYKRGWFRSQATLKWSVKAVDSSANLLGRNTLMIPTKRYTFEMPLVICHGPVMMVDNKLYFGLGFTESKDGFPAALLQEFANQYTFQAPKMTYALRIMVGYLTDISIQFVVPSFTLQAQQGPHYFKWLGFKTDIDVSRNKQKFVVDFSLDGSSWVGNDVEGSLGPVHTYYNVRRASNGLYVGTSRTHLPALRLFKTSHGQQPHEPILNMVDAQISAQSDIENNLFHSAISAKLHQLELGDRRYSHIALDLSLKNLDADLLAAMNRKIISLHSDKGSMLWALLPDVPALLSKGAELEIARFTVTMLDGQVKADLSLRFPKENFTNPFKLLEKIDGKSQWRFSSSVVKNWLEATLKKSMQQKTASQDIIIKSADKAAQKIQQWLDSGVLVQEGSDYSVLITLTQGKLSINGRPFNPELFRI